jgi:ethanolamine permease
VLRWRRPELPRPYRSPLGVPGAAVGALLAIVALVACFADPSVRPGVLGTGIFVLLGLIYYALYSRHRLVAQAPEEQVALRRSEAPSQGPARIRP